MSAEESSEKIKSEKDAAASFIPLSPVLRAQMILAVDEAAERDPWQDGNTIAVYIADLVEHDPNSPELQALLNHIEGLFSVTQRDWISEWIKVGIFETIQNYVANERLKGDRAQKAGDIYGKLGERSKKAWTELNDEWGNSVDQI